MKWVVELLREIRDNGAGDLPAFILNALEAQDLIYRHVTGWYLTIKGENWAN